MNAISIEFFKFLSIFFDIILISFLENLMFFGDNFIFVNKDSTLHDKVSKIATLISYDKKIELDVESNYPAIQVYTGQYLKNKI